MRFPNTLFARTSLTLSAALLVFILFTAIVVFKYFILPIGKQGANDLAALMVLSAKTWVELPADTRRDFELELAENHKIKLVSEQPTPDYSELLVHSPYMLFLEDEFTKRLGTKTHVYQTSNHNSHYWVGIPMAEQTLYLGFPHSHIDAKPPLAAFIIFMGASLFIILTTLLIVRRITRPLSDLAAGVQQLGGDGQFQPLPEDGPEELAQLSRKLNQLNGQIQSLLDNRTTLLGGISHDLRTPLARMRLAVELLDGKEDPDLLQRIQLDLEDMDTLIGRTLEVASLMQASNLAIDEVEIRTCLQKLIAPYQQLGKPVSLIAPASCTLHLNELALCRILCNLLDNAFYYSADKEVLLQLQVKKASGSICVLDQGPGIPEDQLEKVFQPFYRLDPSRNRSTGGTGLGLTIVRQLAEMNNWQLSLENRESGGLSARLEIQEG